MPSITFHSPSDGQISQGSRMHEDAHMERRDAALSRVSYVYRRDVIRIKRRWARFSALCYVCAVTMPLSMICQLWIFITIFLNSCLSLANAFAKPDDNPDIALTTVSCSHHKLFIINKCKYICKYIYNHHHIIVNQI